MLNTEANGYVTASFGRFLVLLLLLLSQYIIIYCVNFFFTILNEYMPHTERVRGPSCYLRTAFHMTSIYGPNAKHEGHEFRWKKRGALTYSTDRENVVRKMFNIFLRN